MKGLSIYQEGQEISAYTSKDEIFEGYVRTRNNIKYVVNSKGKAVKLSELKKVKRIGRLIEQDIKASVGEYLKQNIDLDKVSKASDNEKKELSDAIANQFKQTDNPDYKNADETELSNTILSSLDGASIEQQVEKGEIAEDKAIEKFKKDAATRAEDAKNADPKAQLESINISNIAPEHLFNNKNIQSKILKEIIVEPSAGSEYLQPESNYGMGPDYREDAIDDCMYMISNGEPVEKIVDYLQTEFEIAKDEAQSMYDDLSQDNLEWDDTDVNWEEPDYTDFGGSFNEISDEVDNEFEDELGNVDIAIIGFGDDLVEHLAKKFGGNAAKAIRESKSIDEAVLNLAEQVKMLRVNKIRNKNR